MKKFSFKAVALAAGLVVGGSAFAAQSLDAAIASPTKYASELVVNGTTGLDLAAHADANNLVFTTTLGVTTAQQAYFRIDLSNGAKFKGNPASIVVTGGGASTLSSGGDGASYAVYTLAANAGNTSAAVVTLTLNATGVTVFNQNDTGIRVRLYETLTTAQNPDAASSLSLTDTTNRNYITFSKALTQGVTAATPVADVSPATGNPYTKFVGQAATGISLGTLTEALAARFSAASTTAAQVVESTVWADTSVVTVAATNGADFAYAATSGTTYDTAAKGRVFLSTSATCASTLKAASTLTSSTATFTAVTAAMLANASVYVCVLPEGTAAINAGNYTIAVDNNATSAAYTANDVPVTTLSTVTRNGTTLVAPLVNQPTNWYSRLVLTNSGSTDRTYAVTAIKEDGSTVTLTGDAAGGTILANRTLVVDMPALTTIVPAPGKGARTGLQVVVNGPEGQISGMYQIVEPTGTSISNYTLVKK